jgi:hypothetical protein
MNANRILEISLTIAALTCSHAYSETTYEFKEWDSIAVASAGQTLPDGSTSRLTQSSNFANANPGKAFSLGVFKCGSMHRVTLETLDGGGSAAEQLTFSLGWYVNWDWVQFHTHQIYGDNSTSSFYWAHTYDSSGNMKYGEMELFAVINPQTAGYRCRVHFYGNGSNWSSPQGKSSIDSNQLPLTEVVASQTNYSFGPDNWVYLNGNQVKANGSNILTEATAPGFLSGSGFLQSSGFNSALASSTPPTGSTAWKNAFVPRGSIGGGGLLALGDGADAYGVGSVAIGADYSGAYGTAAMAFGGEAYSDYAFAASKGVANSDYSFATQNALANGLASIAMGGYDFVLEGGNQTDANNATSIGGIRNRSNGVASFSSGNWNIANSAYSVALGSLNLGTAGDSDDWVETDSLFELGNGTAPYGSTPSASARSNAITTLKNGRTTLTNKAWLANSDHPLADPGTASDSDSGGKALVVEGHTELKGKVIISEPQGDISMGIYE